MISLTVVNQYQSLRNITREAKAFRIIEITKLSALPGKSKFKIQVTNKSSILNLNARSIVNSYDLDFFSNFHAQLIKKANDGKLIEFLDALVTNEPLFKIASKKFDRASNQFIFTVTTKEKIMFDCTAGELSNNKHVLSNMNFQDIYDIGFTKGTETILNEKTAILLATQT